MVISLALVLLVTGGGTLLTYLYDEGCAFAARLCAGACIGIASLGLIGFVFASFLGLTPLSILLTALVVGVLPLLTLRNRSRRRAVQQDLRSVRRSFGQLLSHPSELPLGSIFFYVAVAVILFQVFSRAMIVVPEGVYTGLLNNFGDLPFHISVITSFVYGNNYPPEDPTYAGVRFTYPFLTDFVSAIFVRCGADLRWSMFLENFMVALAFVGLLHRWALVMSRDRLAAIITPALVILNGGFGWVFLWISARAHFGDFNAFVKSLPPSFTVIPDSTWRWGNAISTLLVPQRGFLLGLPLAVIVFTQWWLAEEVKWEDEKETSQDGAQEGRRKKEKGKNRNALAKSRSKKAGRLAAEVLRKKEKGNSEVAGDASGSGTSSLVPFSFFLFPFDGRRMLAAGIIAGLLPLVHAHSFVVVLLVGGCIALGSWWRSWAAVLIGLMPLIFVCYWNYPVLPRLNRDFAVFGIALAGAVVAWFLSPRAQRTRWAWFFAAALIVALPQMWWSTHGSAVDSSRFFAWQFGWDRSKEDAVWFWFKNTGLFIPVAVLAIVWRTGKDFVVSRRVVLFLLPFSLCFIIPNALKMAPWIWDNIKVLYYWWLGLAPLIAILLAKLSAKRGWQRGLAVVLFLGLTTAGALDVAGIVWRSTRYQVFTSPGVQFSEIVKQKTPAVSIVMHAPVHNHPVFLTGRRSLMGYPGHIWTHGLDYVQRESEIKRIYAGGIDADVLLHKNKVDYVVASPLERDIMIVNDQFFSKFQLVGDVGGYRLYKIK